MASDALARSSLTRWPGRANGSTRFPAEAGYRSVVRVGFDLPLNVLGVEVTIAGLPRD